MPVSPLPLGTNWMNLPLRQMSPISHSAPSLCACRLVGPNMQAARLARRGLLPLVPGASIPLWCTQQCPSRTLLQMLEEQFLPSQAMLRMQS